jgi:hypothetical protein
VVTGVWSPRRPLTDVGRSRPSGLPFERGLAREDACGTRNPSGQFARIYGGCNGSRHGMGGSVQRSSPACNAPGVTVALTLRGLAQHVEGADALLTEGLWWPVLRCSVEVDDGRAAEAVGIRGEGRHRVTPECWATWIASGGSCEGAAWVKRARGPPAAGNCGGGSAHLRSSSGEIQAKERAGVAGERRRSSRVMRRS